MATSTGSVTIRHTSLTEGDLFQVQSYRLHLFSIGQAKNLSLNILVSYSDITLAARRTETKKSESGAI